MKKLLTMWWQIHLTAHTKGDEVQKVAGSTSKCGR